MAVLCSKGSGDRVEKQGKSSISANFQAGFDCLLNVLLRLSLSAAMADATGNRGVPHDPDTVFITIVCDGEFHATTRCKATCVTRPRVRGFSAHRKCALTPALSRSTGPRERRGKTYAIAPATGIGASSPFFSFNSVIITSVVRARPLTLAAFKSAVRATFVGSITPNLNISPYSAVAAL